MKVCIPSDIQLRMEYRVMADLIGEERASWVVLKLFTALSLSAGTVSDIPGVLSTDVESWLRTELRDGFNAAVASKLLIKREGLEFYVCLLFCENNRIVMFEVPDDSVYSDKFSKWSDKLASSALELIKEIASEHWALDGEMIVPDEMAAAVSLVATIDFVVYRKFRKLKTIPMTSIHHGVTIVRRFNPEDLRIILRRFLAVSRPQLNPRLPAITEEVLVRFDLVCRMISPEEGFAKWYERSKKDQSRAAVCRQLTRKPPFIST